MRREIYEPEFFGGGARPNSLRPYPFPGTGRGRVKPKALAGGDHDVFVAGDDRKARGRVARFLRDQFGWKTVIDLGDLTAARGLEMMIMVWLKIWTALGTSDFNYKIAR